MAEFPFDLTYQDGNLFFVTPNPTWGEFTGSNATMAKIDKEAAYDWAYNGTDPLPAELQSKNVGAPAEPVYQVSALNNYGPDNEITCVWDTVIDANWSNYIPPFKTNQAEIRITEFGDLTVSNLSADYNRTYEAIETRGIILPDGSFSENSEYLWYAVEDGGTFYCVAFKQSSWRAFRTSIDPSTLQDGDLTGNQVIATVTSTTEFIDGLRRAAPGPKSSYAPDGSGYASFANGKTEFSDDFFVGKNELFFDFDVITVGKLSGSTNIFFINETNSTRFIRLQINSRALRMYVKFDDGTSTFKEYQFATLAAGQKVKIGVDFKNYDPATQTNGFLNYYIDGILLDTIVLDKSLDTSLWTGMFFTQQDKLNIKNFQFQDKLKHNGANYTPLSVLPANPFTPVKYDTLNTVYDRVGVAQGLFTLLETGLENVKFSLNGLWYDGFGWVPSTDVQEANTITEVNANANSFPQSDNIQLSVHFWSEELQGQIESLTWVAVGQGYAQSVAFTPVMPFLPPSEYLSAIAGITAPGANTFVTFVIYQAGRRLWYDPVQLAWVDSDATFLQSNSLLELNQNIAELPPSGQWYPITILTSLDEPATGFQNPEPPSVSFLRIFGDVEFNPAPPPLECVVYYFQQSPCGGNDAAKFVFKSDRSFMHGNFLIRGGQPEHDCVITPDDIFSLGDKALIETATLNTSATSVSEKYMYSMYLRDEVTTEFRGCVKTEVNDIFVGYVEIPAQANVTLDELWDARVFEKPANGTATSEMLAQAEADYPIPV